jgi:hypothetical protein
MTPLIPFLRINIATKLTVTEVSNRINCLLKADNAFRTKYYPDIKISAYDGDYRNGSIEIIRHTWYNNSFKPIICGEVKTINDQCVIKMNLRLHVFVLVFVCIFLAGTLTVALLTIASPLTGQGFFISLSLLMAAAMYTFMQVAFVLEARVVQKDMQKLFAPAEIVMPD